MKYSLLLLASVFAIQVEAQFSGGSRKLLLGHQTTGDGLIYRDSGSPGYAPTDENDAFVYYDFASGAVYVWDGSQWNQINLIEDNSPPTSLSGTISREGAFWQDTDDGSLYVYDGALDAWVPFSGIHYADSAPTDQAATGTSGAVNYTSNFWYETDVDTMRIWDGSEWIAIGKGGEQDPIFSGSAAFGITNTDITNWDAAFSWGNHAAAGYDESETNELNVSFTLSNDSLTITDNGGSLTVTGILDTNQLADTAAVLRELYGSGGLTQVYSDGTLSGLGTFNSLLGVNFDTVSSLSALADTAAAIRAGITGITDEEIQDIVGGMVGGNTETLITVTYDDPSGKLDFEVNNDLSQYDNSTSKFWTHSDTVNTLATQSYVDNSSITEVNDLSSAVTWATVPDAFISESSITQHEGAITITESQISDLQHTVNTERTDEEIQDVAGGMTVGNTETLITVTYDDSDGTIDYVVDNDLSNYDNSTSGFITSEVDGSITNEIQTIDNFSITGSTVSLSLSSDGVPDETIDIQPIISSISSDTVAEYTRGVGYGILDSGTEIYLDTTTLDTRYSTSGADGVVSGASFAGGTITLSRTEGLSDVTVDISGVNTDAQTLSFDGSNVSISNGNSVDISALGDLDGVVQSASLVGETLVLGRTQSLSNVTVDLSSLNDVRLDQILDPNGVTAIDLTGNVFTIYEEATPGEQLGIQVTPGVDRAILYSANQGGGYIGVNRSGVFVGEGVGSNGVSLNYYLPGDAGTNGQTLVQDGNSWVYSDWGPNISYFSVSNQIQPFRSILLDNTPSNNDTLTVNVGARFWATIILNMGPADDVYLDLSNFNYASEIKIMLLNADSGDQLHFIDSVADIDQNSLSNITLGGSEVWNIIFEGSLVAYQVSP